MLAWGMHQPEEALIDAAAPGDAAHQLWPARLCPALRPQTATRPGDIRAELPGEPRPEAHESMTVEPNLAGTRVQNVLDGMLAWSMHQSEGAPVDVIHQLWSVLLGPAFRASDSYTP